MRGEWQVTAVQDIDITYDWEGWSVRCGWPRRRGTDVVTLVEVENQGKLLSAPHRLNIFSLSAVTGMTRIMKAQALPGDEARVSEFVQHIMKDVYSWYQQGGAMQNPTAAQQEDGGWLLYPLWPTVGVTGIVAAAGSFKSLMAQAIALELVSGQEVLSGSTRVPEPLKKVLYLDWEGDAATFGERLYGLCEGAGIEKNSWLSYKQMRAPLAAVAPQIAEEIGKVGVQAVIVDSMSAGIGGPLKEDESVNAFFDALGLLNVPVLVVAHKSAENVRKRSAAFFGSVMSENRVRFAWNAERSADTPSVVWEVFKDNTMGRKGARMAWNVLVKSEGEFENQRLSEIVIDAVNPHDVRMKAGGDGKLRDRIVYLLIENGPLRVADIAHRAESSEGTVRKEVNRHSDMFVKGEHGTWDLRGDIAPDPY